MFVSLDQLQKHTVQKLTTVVVSGPKDLDRVRCSTGPRSQRWNSLSHITLPLLNSTFYYAPCLPSISVAAHHAKRDGRPSHLSQFGKPRIKTQRSCLMRGMHCDSLNDIAMQKTLFSVFCVSLPEICVISELEDLSASVDVQDVYTKIKCKVGSFNIDHYRRRYSTSSTCKHIHIYI